MRQLLIVVDQIGYVDIAVVLLEQSIFLELIPIQAVRRCAAKYVPAAGSPVDIVVVVPEVEDKVLQLGLYLDPGILVLAKAWLINVSRVHRLAIHVCDCDKLTSGC